MSTAMDDISPPPPAKVPPVEPALLGSAVFLFAEYLQRIANVPITLNLYMRVTALFRLLAASPSLARLAADGDESANALSETALVAAARLDLHINRSDGGGVADFDPRQFRDALTAE